MYSDKKNNLIANVLVEGMVNAILNDDNTPETLKNEVSAIAHIRKTHNAQDAFVEKFVLPADSENNKDKIITFLNLTKEYIEKIKNLMEEKSNVSE